MLTLLRRDETAPWNPLLWKLGTPILVFLEWLRYWLAPASLTIIDVTMGYMRSQIVYTITKLQIADHLASGPQTADELAQLAGEPQCRGSCLIEEHQPVVHVARCGR